MKTYVKPSPPDHEAPEGVVASSPGTVGVFTRALYFLARQGKAGREIAVRLDMARATSASHVWRRYVGTKRQSDDGAVNGGDVITAVYREIWRNAATVVGAEVEEGIGGNLEIRKNGVQVSLRRKAVGLNHPDAVARAADKVQVHQRLDKAGVVTPRYLEFELSSLGEAVAFLMDSDGACVVKPVRGEGGYGVTCGVRTEDELIRAAIRASRTDPLLLVEEEIRGDFYRFLLLDGEVLSIVHRDRPTVVGDGQSTLEELIFAENRARAGAKIALPGIRIDFDCLTTLKTAGLALDSVVARGEAVPVKTVISQNAPRENSIVGEPVSDELRDEVVRAVEALGLRLAGVDVVTPTLDESLGSSGGAVLEVNGAPGLTYHYEVAEDSRIDRVAVPILRKMLADEQGATTSSIAAAGTIEG
jgi:glutathione synthase/RimK-type ligase-like ATP-grasp enzyme